MLLLVWKEMYKDVGRVLVLKGGLQYYYCITGECGTRLICVVGWTLTLLASPSASVRQLSSVIITSIFSLCMDRGHFGQKLSAGSPQKPQQQPPKVKQLVYVHGA